MNTAAVIVAAGEGRRMGGAIRKQYMKLEGIPVLVRSVKLFLGNRNISSLVIVIPPGDSDTVIELLKPYCSPEGVVLVHGGASRQQSVLLGLLALSSETDMVCIHDAVRPLASAALLDDLLAAAGIHGAAIPVIPLSDTIKQVDENGFVQLTPSRDQLRMVQTPQVFRKNLVMQAYASADKSGLEFTDDAALLERCGYPVITVPGEESNLKVTTPGDLKLASLLLKGASGL